MKKIFLLTGLIISFAMQAQEPLYHYTFFSNSRMADFYFFSQTASSGNSSIKNVGKKLPISKTIFHTPGNSLRLNYVNAKNGKWEAFVYRQQIRGQDHFKEGVYLSFLDIQCRCIN